MGKKRREKCPTFFERLIFVTAHYLYWLRVILSTVAVRMYKSCPHSIILLLECGSLVSHAVHICGSFWFQKCIP